MQYCLLFECTVQEPFASKELGDHSRKELGGSAVVTEVCKLGNVMLNAAVQ